MTMRTDKDLDDLLCSDASAQVSRAEGVPNLHRSMLAMLARTSTVAPRSRLRSALVPVSAAVAAAAIIAIPIVFISYAHHGKPGGQAPPAAAHSSSTSPQPALSSSCAFQAVQATIDDQAPVPLLSCTGFARGAYPDANAPVLAAKVGATVLIGGSLLGRDARLSVTTGTASLLTRVSDHEWRLLVRQAGQLTVQVSSPALCRGSHQPCGLVTVTASQ
jgi:hypothetical protein